MLAFFNVLTRKKELFKPIRKTWAGLYTCGPTVYNYAHIGNLRTYIFEDVLRRTLEYSGYKVRHVMNITDVDDKIIRDAKAAGETIFDFVKPYEEAFFKDLAMLNILPATKYAKATDHIADMVKLIQTLLKKGIAYQMDGSVYFSIKQFKPYGKLSRVSSRRLKTGARMDRDEYTKQSVQDFALWKAQKEGEPSWSAPFGKGHPGWHIECSAMSMKYLGATFDIHAGGVDLIFPHHENEIAQSEGATEKPFVRFFMEGEHLLVDGEKMSKSLGNFFTLRDFEIKKINPLCFRYLVLMSHYRSKFNFTWESLEAAKHSLEKLYDVVRTLKSQGSKTNRLKKKLLLTSYQKKIKQALANDLNAPNAVGIVWDMIRAYRKAPERFDAKELLHMLYDVDRVLGFRLKDIESGSIPPMIFELAQEREMWRRAKDWRKADEVRQKISEAGYIINDTPDGPNIKQMQT